MGKALPKVCEVCNKTISGNNWSRHKSTHPNAADIKGKVVREPIKLKRGRPKKPNKYPLDTDATVRAVKLRGMAIYAFTTNKLQP